MRSSSPEFFKPSHAESRQALRVSALIQSVLGSSRFGKRTVWLLDVSTLGCRVETGLSVPVGTRLVLTVPGLSPLGCQVRWIQHGSLGLCFATPLHSVVVDQITAQSIGT